MKNVLALTFPAGAKKIAVTSITLVNATSKTQDVTVPSGKRWILLGIEITNPDSVNRAVTINHYKEAAKTNFVEFMGYLAALGSLGRYHIPNTITGTSDVTHGRRLPKPMDPGETIEIIWSSGGASAGGTNAAGLVVEYLEL